MWAGFDRCQRVDDEAFVERQAPDTALLDYYNARSNEDGRWSPRLERMLRAAVTDETLSQTRVIARSVAKMDIPNATSLLLELEGKSQGEIRRALGVAQFQLPDPRAQAAAVSACKGIEHRTDYPECDWMASSEAWWRVDALTAPPAVLGGQDIDFAGIVARHPDRRGQLAVQLESCAAFDDESCWRALVEVDRERAVDAARRSDSLQATPSRLRTYADEAATLRRLSEAGWKDLRPVRPFSDAADALIATGLGMNREEAVDWSAVRWAESLGAITKQQTMTWEELPLNASGVGVQAWGEARRWRARAASPPDAALRLINGVLMDLSPAVRCAALIDGRVLCARSDALLAGEADGLWALHR